MNKIKMVILLLSLLIAGCWDNVDIKDRAVVIGIGIDPAGEPGRINVCLQLALPTGQGDDVGATEQESVIICGSGTTISTAITSMQTRLPREIFLGQVQSIIINQEVARDATLMERIIDDLMREPIINRNAFLLVSYNAAETILQSDPPLQRLSALFIAESFDRVRFNIVHPKAELWKFFRALESPGWAPFAIGVDADDEQIELTGLALFDRYEMVGWLSPLETRGLMWLTGMGAGITVSINTDLGPAEISLTSVRLTPRPAPTDELIVQCGVRVTGNIMVKPPQVSVLAEPDFEQMETALAQTITQEATASLQTMKRHGTDAAGIGRLIYYRRPDLWADLDWTKDFERARVEIDVQARIDRRGALN